MYKAIYPQFIALKYTTWDKKNYQLLFKNASFYSFNSLLFSEKSFSITDPTRLWPPIYPSVPKVLMRYSTILIK